MISIFVFQPPERPPKKLHLLKKVSKSTKPSGLAFWEMLFFRMRVALVRFQTSRLDESSCWLLDRLPPTFVRETLWSWTRALPPNQSLLNSFAHSSTTRPPPGVPFTLHSLDPTPAWDSHISRRPTAAALTQFYDSWHFSKRQFAPFTSATADTC